MSFKKAVKSESKLRMAIAGPSGSGKTYTSLSLAVSLGAKVAVIDTEYGSAEKYADLFNFDVVNMAPPYSPAAFIKLINEAVAERYNVVVIDSISHAWNGTGGVLQMVEAEAKRQKTPNTYTAWGAVTPHQQALIDCMMSAPIHIIATMRSKTKYALDEQDRNGRKVSVPVKMGMEPIQREGFEYEFDFMLEMTADNCATVTKSRAVFLTNQSFEKPSGAELGAVLLEWLKGEKPTAERVSVTEKPAPKGITTTFTASVMAKLPYYGHHNHVVNALAQYGITSIDSQAEAKAAFAALDKHAADDELTASEPATDEEE